MVCLPSFVSGKRSRTASVRVPVGAWEKRIRVRTTRAPEFGVSSLEYWSVGWLCCCLALDPCVDPSVVDSADVSQAKPAWVVELGGHVMDSYNPTTNSLYMSRGVSGSCNGVLFSRHKHGQMAWQGEY